MATLTPRIGARLERAAGRHLDVESEIDRSPVVDLRPRRLVRTTAWLLAIAVFITLIAPEILGLTRQWSEVTGLGAGALIGAAALQFAALGCLAVLHRLLLPGSPWRTLLASELAGAALTKVTPGGGAAGPALQHRMLVRAGLDRDPTLAGLTAGVRLTFAVATLLPIVAVAAAIASGLVPSGVLSAAGTGLVAFGGLAIGGWAFLADDDPVRARAFLAAVARAACDFGSLLVILAAIGAHPRPALILLAFCAGQLLAQVPVTPGGLGFVETGMTLMLSLAGVAAGPAALATFTYRLLTYWLVVPVGLLAFLIDRQAPRRAAHARPVTVGSDAVPGRP